MKRTRMTSRWYALRCGYKTVILYENQLVEFKRSKILEPWIDIYIDGNYNGTISLSDFKLNFRLDNLLDSE